MNIFIFDNIKNEVMLNEPEVLLIKEFSVLWKGERNITKEDETGSHKSRAFKEFTYMYLMIDWQSLYSQDPEHKRHEAAISDSGLTQEEFDDPDFRAACRRYRDIQNSDRQVRLVKSAQNKCDELTDYFEDGSDLMERDQSTGKPIFKAKDVMGELSSVSKLLEELDRLEARVKKRQKADSGLRAGATEGFIPTGI